MMAEPRIYVQVCVVGAAASFVLAFFATWVMTRWAPALGLIDMPNRRSAHVLPTARGGGIAIVIVVLLLVSVEAVQQLLDTSSVVVLLAGGSAVALIGLADDRFGLGIRPRLAVHVSVAVLAIALLGDLPAQQAADLEIEFGPIPLLFTAVAVVWMLNLFNFMDGIDGIAAGEAIFVCGAGAILVAMTGGAPGLAILLSGTAGACMGFLLWNWAPAKIFLGDVGSGFLGYLTSVIALIATRESTVPIWTWLILTSLFIADASVTLLRRMTRGDSWHAPHRTHGYQWLSRRWGSHARVTLAYLGVNVVVIFPLAFASVRLPSVAAWMALISLAAAGSVMLAVGAGRSED